MYELNLHRSIASIFGVVSGHCEVLREGEQVWAVIRRGAGPIGQWREGWTIESPSDWALIIMNPPPSKRQRKKLTQIRDQVESDEDADDGGYMNTRESNLDSRGRIFSVNVSPQKKSTKQPWAARRIWNPPVDLELGLDMDSLFYERVVDAEVYDVPQPQDEVVAQPTKKKQRRTLRTVCLITWSFYCSFKMKFSLVVTSSSILAEGVSTDFFG